MPYFILESVYYKYSLIRYCMQQIFFSKNFLFKLTPSHMLPTSKKLRQKKSFQNKIGFKRDSKGPVWAQLFCFSATLDTFFLHCLYYFSRWGRRRPHFNRYVCRCHEYDNGSDETNLNGRSSLSRSLTEVLIRRPARSRTKHDYWRHRFLPLLNMGESGIQWRGFERSVSSHGASPITIGYWTSGVIRKGPQYKSARNGQILGPNWLKRLQTVQSVCPRYFKSSVLSFSYPVGDKYLSP